MERAIANHDFEEARAYSNEERKEREHLRLLCEEFNLEVPRLEAPLVCIEVIGAELFSELRQRCEGYIAEGVAEVWLLDPGLKRAYTITRVDGLREFKGESLQIVNPPSRNGPQEHIWLGLRSSGPAAPGHPRRTLINNCRTSTRHLPILVHIVSRIINGDRNARPCRRTSERLLKMGLSDSRYLFRGRGVFIFSGSEICRSDAF